MRLVTFLLTILGVLAAACGGDDSSPAATGTPAPGATSTPDASAVFPVVLEGQTLVVASADGSEITETPLQPGERPIFGPSYISPGGERTATFEDGTLFIQENGDAPVAIAEIASDAEFAHIVWSPDGARLMFDVSFRDESPSLYVINADGSGLTDVGAGLEGDSFLVGWSPDGQRFAMGLYTPIQRSGEGLDALLYVVGADGTERTLTGEYLNFHGYEGSTDLAKWSPDGSRIAVFPPRSEDAIRLMDPSGGPAVDIPGSRFPRFSWSPDSQLLAFDEQAPVGSDSDGIMVVDIASPGELRVLTEGYWPRWSPSGDRIAFKRGEFGSSQVYTIRPDGSGLVSLGELGPEARSELTWSADGESVEFVRSAPAAQYLYAVELSTGEVVRSPEPLIDAPFVGPRRSARLSPDGDEIAFSIQGYETGKDGEGAGWFTMDVVTGEIAQITNDPREGDVYWSPQGIRLAFSAGSGGVFVTEGDGSPRQLTEFEAFSIAWSPDGSRVALQGPDGVRVVDADGGGEGVVVEGPLSESVALDSIEWSSDGTRLLYRVSRGDPNGVVSTEVFVAPLDGTTPNIVVPARERLSGARWSPDGQTVAFTVTPDEDFEVWLVDADGTDPRRIASFEGEQFGLGRLSWSPDGSSLAVVLDQDDVWMIDVQSGESVLVATNVGNCAMSFVGWSPDGEVIYAIPSCALGGL